jgi:hypothetical protein
MHNVGEYNHPHHHGRHHDQKETTHHHHVGTEVEKKNRHDYIHDVAGDD